MPKLYLNPKAAEEMFTPDTPKRTQIAACMKIVGCFLGVITYLHKASFLHWAAFTDRSRTFAKRTLEHLALRPI